MPRILRPVMVLALFATVPAVAQNAPPRAAIDSFAQAFLSSRVGPEVGSASLVVVHGDSVLYLRSFGLAQPRRQVAATPDGTIYQVGSNSKLFVTTAAMQLVEQGRLRLDADINRYLGDLQVDGGGAPVTMAQLLTHTSGIEDRKLGRTQAREDGPILPLGEFFRRFPPHRAFPGGQELNYSGNAMALAAHVIEQISGEPFDQYAAQHIFLPLGMHSATFHQPLPDSLLARRAAMPNLPPLIAYPAGGLAMTTADMGRFLIAQLNGGAVGGTAILKPETVALMQRHHFPADTSLPGIGYGFFETKLGGRRALLHTGDYQHISVLCLIPEAKLGFFLVVNPMAELREPLLTIFLSSFADRFLRPAPAPPAAPAPAAEVPATVASGLVGFYRDHAIPATSLERFFVGLLFGEGDARVTYDADRKTLLFQPPDAEPLPLTPLGDGRFRTTDEKLGAQLEFRMAGDRAAALYVSAGALGAYTFGRIPGLLSQRIQVGFFLGTLGLFSLWLLTVLIRFGRARLSRAPVGSGARRDERVPLWAASVTALFGAGGFVLFSLLGLSVPSVAMMTGIPAAFRALPLAFTAACLSAVALPYALASVWRRGTFGLALRLLFTATALAGIAFVPFCWYWRLLGVHL